MNRNQEFIDVVWDYYAKSGRSLPWRNPEADGSFDPYKILVSEIMLQQTQVGRVTPKYKQWLIEFPDIKSLASAPLSRVLEMWSGLGYNRRARFLHESAKAITSNFGGVMPQTQAELVALPGVGQNTAGAILAYAFNKPTVFIETNVRTVYLYHYFQDQQDVSDKQLIPIIEATIDHENSREWYWALMDYGSYLKATTGNFSRNSRHHQKQSKFVGSKRQIRGKIITILVNDKAVNYADLKKQISDERFDVVLKDLQAEGLAKHEKEVYSLAD